MKLLLDQNISYRVIDMLSPEFREAIQVKSVGLENTSDEQIWRYALANSYNIVTFDADFFEIANIKGHPPKILWLRCGNLSTKFLAKTLNSKVKIIRDFIQDPEYAELACLEIH